MSDYNKVLCAACGAIPLLETILKKVPRYSGHIYPKINAKEKDMAELLKSLKQASECSEQYLKTFRSWKEERLHCIEELRNLADRIHFHHRNTTIAQIPASAAGIVGGALGIAGLVLIPVTAGLSLGLTVSGAVIGGGAAVAGTTSTLTDIGIRIDSTNKANKYFEEHAGPTNEINETITELLENCAKVEILASKEMMEVFNALKLHDGAECVKHVVSGIVTAALICNDIVKLIPKLLKHVNLIRNSLKVATIATTSVSHVAEIAVDGATSSTKAAIVTVSKGLTSAAVVFGAIGIVVDGALIAFNIYDLLNGSKTSAEERLRELAEAMERELYNAEEISKKLGLNLCG